MRRAAKVCSPGLVKGISARFTDISDVPGTVATNRHCSKFAAVVKPPLEKCFSRVGPAADQRIFRLDPRSRFAIPFGRVLHVGLCVAGFAIFAFANFGRLFLLIEYRQWASPLNVFNPIQILNPWTWFDARIFSMVFSRSIAILTAGVATVSGGYTPACHNFVQIGLIIASAVLLAATLRRLFPKAPTVLLAGAVVFILFSEGMLDALALQSTLLDKLALFFSSLGYTSPHSSMSSAPIFDQSSRRTWPSSLSYSPRTIQKRRRFHLCPRQYFCSSSDTWNSSHRFHGERCCARHAGACAF